MHKADLYSILQAPSHAENGDMYRRLGYIEHIFEDTGAGQVARNMMQLLEGWALLRLEHADLPLSQLCGAGKWLSGYHKEQHEQGKRVLHILAERYFPISAEGALQLYKAMKGTDGGTFRNHEMWIGGTSALDAKYVSPSPDHIEPSLESIHAYLESKEASIQLLGRLHSFGFLHLPFSKDNARWAALWTHVLAKELQIPRHGSLPFTLGILTHRQQYSYDLIACAEGRTDAWDATWELCMHHTLMAAEKVAKAAEQLWEFTLEHEEVFGKGKQHVRPLVLHLARCPYVTQGDIADLTELTKPNASILMKRCLDIGLLKQVTFEHRNRVYMAPKIVQVLAGC